MMGAKKIILLASLLAMAYTLSPGARVYASSEGSIYTSSRVCGECHKEIYKRWKNSMHAFSLQDPIFDSAYTEAYRNTKGESRYLCLKCHVPTTNVTGDYDLKLQISSEGITCDFCHSVKRVNLESVGFPYTQEVSNVKRGPIPLKKDAADGHEVEYSELHTTSAFCAGCHQYTNPNGVLVLGTYNEWLASPYSDKGIQCQDCHMPLIPEQKSAVKGSSSSARRINEHNLAGGHSIKQLKKAIKLDIAEINKDGNLLNVAVKIANVGSGHMVPTGLPTRKLILKVEVKTADGRMVSNARKVYQKVLVDEKGEVITRDSQVWYAKKVLYDNRLIPLLEHRKEEFTFLLPKGGASYLVNASVSYLYEPTIPQKQKMELVMDSVSQEVE